MNNFDKLYEAVMSEDDVELGITPNPEAATDLAPMAAGVDQELTPREHLAKAIELLQKLQSLDLIPDEAGSDEDMEASDEDMEVSNEDNEDNEEFATEEVEAEDLGHALVNAKKGLELSKASVSTGTRQLLGWHAIKQVWKPGDRKDYYEVQADLAEILRANYIGFFRPKVDASKRKLTLLLELLDADLKSGQIDAADHVVCKQRLESLSKMQSRIQRLLPLAEKLL